MKMVRIGSYYINPYYVTRVLMVIDTIYIYMSDGEYIEVSGHDEREIVDKLEDA